MSETQGLWPAMLAVRAEAPTFTKDATNPAFRSKYATLDAIVETIDPILCRHGLVWTTLPVRDDMGDPALKYKLAHAASGEVLEGTMPLLLVKMDPQGQGSAITYARRYALCSVLNLVADDDDDGAAGSHTPPHAQNARPAAKGAIPEDLVGLIAREYAASGWKDPGAQDEHAVLRVTLLSVGASKTDGPIVDCIRALNLSQAEKLRAEFKKPSEKS